MEFTEFAQKIKPIIGGSYSTHVFTKTLFESIITEEGLLQIEDYTESTFKSYFNGKTKITSISRRILPYVEPPLFSEYLDNFSDATIQKLCDAFHPYINDINLHNASEKIANLFDEILKTAASQKRKSTPKSANKSSQDILEEKLLATSQTITNNGDSKISDLANDVTVNDKSETEIISLPNEQVDESPYSLEDNLLLQEFTADYDETMLKLIGENYAESLIDMTVPNKIKDLYDSKWCSKANSFLDPSLKSYVFSLLGELNNISKCFLDESSCTPFLISTRTKIRNLYVKLHPDQFAYSFPYDAFIDDWDDGEYL